jgi:cyclophilin family peptidyl-prolyl cis-trans isomerase
VIPRSLRAALAPALLLAACGTSTTAGAPDAASSAPPLAGAPPEGERVEAILAIEHRRAEGEIIAADQQSRSVALRRAAARAAARIGGEAARAALLRALADEDEEVVAWAAYGLGFTCKAHEKEHVSALVSRALSRSGDPGRAPAVPAASASAAPAPAAPPGLDALRAIARAIGKCAAEESEPTLVAWLAGPRDRAVAAAYALGDLGAGKQKLREETLAALLNLAAGSASSPPLPDALFPVGRLEHVPLTVVDRIREVATARLAEAGDARIFAVRALGRGGDDAAPELERVLTAGSAFSASERAEAARSLKRLGKAGQLALVRALPGLVPRADPVALTGLVGDDFGVLLTLLESLDAPGGAKKSLLELASLAPPPAAPPAIARRLSWLRCAAARLLAGDDIRDKLLAACDLATPEGALPADASKVGSIGGRALVQALAKGEIKGGRAITFRQIAKSGELRAREAALELLESHDELSDAAALLTEALSAKEPGLIGTAAEVLSKQPQRAGDAASAGKVKKPRKKKGAKNDDEPPSEGALAPSPALVKALLEVLGRQTIGDDPETCDGVIDAAGALALKEARPRLEELCRSPYPTTREHAQKALALLGGEKRVCEPPAGGGPAPAELAALVRAPTTLRFDTDVGPLAMTLDPALAPVIVTRVVALARAGYYDGMIVHRVVPGFVTQFGAPFGDGSGGPEGKPAVRCETSPLPFLPMAVGVALAGRDTGSSQIFVTHTRTPHLDGQYAIIGGATGPWASFVDGDLIRGVKVSP